MIMFHETRLQGYDLKSSESKSKTKAEIQEFQFKQQYNCSLFFHNENI